MAKKIAARKAIAIKSKSVANVMHVDAKRPNIPTIETSSLMRKEEAPRKLRYSRNSDLDPQLVWRGKDDHDWNELVVHAPPLYIQEKVHPKVLIDDLMRKSQESRYEAGEMSGDLFSDFNGIPKGVDKTEYYQHEQNWSNRMILGDSLQVMASLSEREKLRGKVQCIYFDPPYGIKFNSNFQWSTTNRDVKDGNIGHITREPEQVKAFRDTWRDGIHSYLTYLRDRLLAARDLLADSGSIFLQIGDENVSRVRSLMDEIFGEKNFVSIISYAKTTGFSGKHLSSVCDYLLWFSKSISHLKYRGLYDTKQAGGDGASKYKQASSLSSLSAYAIDATRLATSADLTSQGASPNSNQKFTFRSTEWKPPPGLHWKTTVTGLGRLAKAERVIQEGKSLRYVRYMDDFAIYPRNNVWLDVGGIQSRTDPKVYVVQTAVEAIKRCILMTTDPGDLVLDPTCGSGTTATVAEQWGRRWITIDTSRVALALARARIMGARYRFYVLADSRGGQLKEADVSGLPVSTQPVRENIRQGFVYERVPHITLRSIANNSEIDIIHDKWHAEIVESLSRLNSTLADHKASTPIALRDHGRGDVKVDASRDSMGWEDLREWEVPRQPPSDWPPSTHTMLAAFWKTRFARQTEIEASIAAKAEFEYLYDKPYEDNKCVRVAGPFTVESASPHRMLGVDQDHELVDPMKLHERTTGYTTPHTFEQMILDNLKLTGMQQANKQDSIAFISLTPWPGDLVCAEGCYLEGERERRAGIFIGPEFGTVTRPDLVAAAREASEAGFDVLVACAFNYQAQTTELETLGRLPIIKARMNADLHMSDDLKITGKGNLFVVFGEPDIEILEEASRRLRVKVRGIDVFDPSTGEVRSDSTDGIACWFVDTDYNEESFFVRQAYFLGQNDPYRALKTTLKAEINEEAWESLHSDTSRPFDKPKSGRIAVKVINHLGDEVMKVFRI